jgi:hypothetical protein
MDKDAETPVNLRDEIQKRDSCRDINVRGKIVAVRT